MCDIYQSLLVLSKIVAVLSGYLGETTEFLVCFFIYLQASYGRDIFTRKSSIRQVCVSVTFSGSTLKFCLHDTILKVAGSYLQCFWAVTELRGQIFRKRTVRKVNRFSFCQSNTALLPQLSFSNFRFLERDARWPNGQCTGLRIERFRFEPRPGTAVCSWAKHFTLTVPLSTQVYKWIPANLLLGVTLRWTCIPSRGEQKYSLSLHATETGINPSTDGPLGS